MNPVSNGLLVGARLGIPIAISFFAFGLAFGVAAASRDISPLTSGLVSLLVFSGSTQFLILDLLGRPEAALTIAVSVFLLNIRHVVMGAALLASSPDKPLWQRITGLVMMIDETWAVAMAPQSEGDRLRIILGSGLVAICGWVAGTVSGSAVGQSFYNIEQFGVDFIYFAVFIFILVSMAGRQPTFIPWLVAALVALAAKTVLPGNWYVVVGGLVGATVGGAISWNKLRLS